ncbi:MAG TPA: hypothetical protein VL201_05710, partial [Patescibacteria group bacterium]|nr:hypothetical protein [Patescibacteria group bacterium]
MQKIIFYKADFSLQQSLALTCKSFFDVAKKFVEERCSFNDFVDKLYSVPHDSKVFKALCAGNADNNFQDEHKKILQNYYFFKGDSLLRDKKSVTNVDLVQELVIANGKKRVKYYSDYCNAVCCLEILKRNSDNKNKHIFWFDEISLEELMNRYTYIKQNIEDMRSLDYDFQKVRDIQKFIEKICENKKVSILVFFLSQWMEILKKTSNNIRSEVRDIFSNAKTDELRKLLAKSGYAL